MNAAGPELNTCRAWGRFQTVACRRGAASTSVRCALPEQLPSSASASVRMSRVAGEFGACPPARSSPGRESVDVADVLAELGAQRSQALPLPPGWPGRRRPPDRSGWHEQAFGPAPRPALPRHPRHAQSPPGRRHVQGGGGDRHQDQVGDHQRRGKRRDEQRRQVQDRPRLRHRRARRRAPASARGRGLRSAASPRPVSAAARRSPTSWRCPGDRCRAG